MPEVTLESVLRDVYANYCTTDATKAGGPLLLEVRVLGNEEAVKFTIGGTEFLVFGNNAMPL